MATIEVDQVIDPATGSVITEIPSASADDVAHAVDIAATAFPAWSRTTPASAPRCSTRSPTGIEARATELGDLESRNAGKPITAMPEEIDMCVDTLRFFAGSARTMDGRAAGEYLEDHTSFVRREPVGVVAAITPWNYPLMMASWKVGPGARGRQHAHPQAVRAHAPHHDPARRDRGRGAAARRACRWSAGAVRRRAPRSSPTPGSRSISFTGSVEHRAARSRRSASDNLTRVHLELGGKAPVVVFDDADLDALVEAVVMAGLRQRGPGLHRVVPGARRPGRPRRRRRRARRSRPRAPLRRPARRGDRARTGDLTRRSASGSPGMVDRATRRRRARRDRRHRSPTAPASSTSRPSSSIPRRTPRSCSARCSVRS